MENKLKPCCKCGGQAGVLSISVPSDENCVYYHDLYYVQCDLCDECTDYSQNKYDAINDWNRRTENGI